MKYTKAQIICEVENWIRDLECVYENSEVSIKCLVNEWEHLRKKIEVDK